MNKGPVIRAGFESTQGHGAYDHKFNKTSQRGDGRTKKIPKYKRGNQVTPPAHFTMYEHISPCHVDGISVFRVFLYSFKELVHPCKITVFSQHLQSNAYLINSYQVSYSVIQTPSPSLPECHRASEFATKLYTEIVSEAPAKK